MLEDGEFSALHISNAILAPGSKGSQMVFISMKGSGDNVATRDIKNLCVATLQADKKEQQALDIYINVSQDITISTKGPNEVHLSGYFEPSADAEHGALGDMEEVLGLEDDEEEEEEDDDSEEEEVATKKQKKDLVKPKGVVGFDKGGDVAKGLKAAKKNALMNTKTEESDDDSDEDDSDEELDLAALKAGAEDDEDEDSEDEDADLDLEAEDDDDNDDDILAAKIADKAKSTQKKLGGKQEIKKKPAPQEDSDDDEMVSDLDDGDSDDEEPDL